MKQRLHSLLPPLAAAALFLALLLDPAGAAAGMRDGLSLSLGTAVPALFPFFLASSLLISTGGAAALGRLLARPCRALFGLPGAAAPALVLGLAGGYPVGARTVRELYEQGLLSREDAGRALACCNNTGPGFLVGLCGATLLGSRKAGFFLYAIHAISAVLTGVALARQPGEVGRFRPQAVECRPLSTCFVEGVQGAGVTALRVTGFITTFSVLLRLLRNMGAVDLFARLLAPLCPLLGLPRDCAQALVLGSLELTCGLSALPAGGGRLLLPAVSFLVALGGLSVWCQSAAVLAGSGLSVRPCVIGKCLHALLAGALSTILLSMAPRALPTFTLSMLSPEPGVLPGTALLIGSILLPFLYRKARRHLV